MRRDTLLVVRDITPAGWTTPFPAFRSHIELDSTRKSRKRRVHQLVYQQGPTYGTPGDMCEYLTDSALRELESAGAVKTWFLDQVLGAPRG